MTKKRLTRDLKWGFQYFPYHQLWMDNEIYTGWVAINYLTDGEYLYWDFSKAGKSPVAGKGMCWLTLIPDGKSRSITAMFTKDRTVSAWYVDVIDKVQIDEDGVVAFIDKYLDVMFTKSGDVIIDDKDELEAAFSSGELSKEQYEKAIIEGENIVSELCRDIVATEKWCCDILQKAEEMIRQHPFTIFLYIDNSKLYYQELVPEAVEKFAQLVNRTNANVVAISDVTTCDSAYKTKTEKIKVYLEKHPEIEKYAILDNCCSEDYSLDKEIKRHLVVIDEPKGLQDENCIQVCKLMNEITLKEIPHIDKT